MASGDTKTQQYLDIAARGTRADLQRGCCNTRTQDLIMDVAERIITEEETRYREDQILQGEIDEIKNNPDVFDIVATYADLQNYDTSTITDKDIIRVLRDETHDNASTYYRWDAADQEFDYIGETGDYYTKAQVNALLALKADKATTYTKTETDALLDGKQDVLTAGENITIEDESGSLVISATDTTYSNFTGTDGTAAGAAGLVPAPATTDAGKFLKADGTWAEAGGGSTVNVVQTTGTSETDVMSQKATTSMIFNDPSTKYQVKIGAGSGVGINRNVAIGRNATAASYNSLAVGSYAWTDAQYTTAVGDNAYGVKEGGTALGYMASTGNTALYGTALGAGSNVDGTYNYSVALGAKSRATRSGEVNVGTGNNNYGFNSTKYRVIGGVHDGQELHDAATVAQGNTLSTSAPTTSTVGVLGQLYTDTTNMHTYQCTAISGNTYTWTQRW